VATGTGGGREFVGTGGGVLGIGLKFGEGITGGNLLGIGAGGGSYSELENDGGGGLYSSVEYLDRGGSAGTGRIFVWALFRGSLHFERDDSDCDSIPMKGGGSTLLV
jgi:hypothetical protein